MRRLLISVLVATLLFPAIINAQNAKVEGTAMYSNISTQFTKMGDAGSSVYLADSSKIKFNEKFYDDYIEWKGRVVATGPLRILTVNKYDGTVALLLKDKKRKERRKVIDSLISGAKASKTIMDGEFSNIRVGADRTTVVDRDGKFSFDNVKPGTYYIMITHNNNGVMFGPFDSDMEKVKISSGETKSIEFIN